MPSDFAALAALADDITREAGALLLEGRGRARSLVETKSTGTDMVTEIDRASEALITRRLAADRPGDGLIGEEGASIASSTGVTWVADPLDGTTNYLYDQPAFCVSLAAEVDGRSVAGAVHDPIRGETFVASLGGGATCNGRTITIEGPPSLAVALVGTGFSYLPEMRRRQAQRLPELLPRVRDIRRAGAAALDLASVAIGRLDGYFEWGLQRWDWAAGSLIVTEAGGRVGQLADETYVAAAPSVFDALFALVDETAALTAE